MTRTAQAAPDILSRIECGESLRGACAANKLTHTAFLLEIRHNEDLRNQYALALERSTDSEVEGMRELEDKVLRGEIDAQAFRAVADVRKWRWSKRYPKKYGDKLQVGGDAANPLTFTVVSGISRVPGAAITTNVGSIEDTASDTQDAEFIEIDSGGAE